MQVVRRALISVSDKDGIVDFARGLAALGVEIVSTGGTAALLRENDLDIQEVSQVTGFPEIMDGRVKTLHPGIHGGILARRGLDDGVLESQGIDAIDLVVVNLYPFEAAVARDRDDLATAVENIDIGGPAMLRAAAKNHTWVAVVSDSADYTAILQELRDNDGALSDATRYALAVKAFQLTARYDGSVANYLDSRLAGDASGEFPAVLQLTLHRREEMRYGENPHQRAAFYVEPGTGESSPANARQLQGKALSFNNVADTDAALECVKSFPEAPACVIVKHANPCGAALGETQLSAYQRAYSTDPTSAFGGIIAFNAPLDGETAAAVVEGQFVEVIIAPGVTPEAEKALAAKSNVRVLVCEPFQGDPAPARDYKRVVGGFLVQDRDQGRVTDAGLQVVTRRAPTNEERRDLLFAWRVAKFVKSNAIVFCRDTMTIGVGAGQMSRVYSARIAALKARDEGLEVAGSVMASDAFFPFRDGIDQAAEAGIGAVIQPGGSRRDSEVVAAADEHGMAMVFTGMRHFRH